MSTTKNLAKSGCCPLSFNCFEETGSELNYYPGNCPNFKDCWHNYKYVRDGEYQEEENRKPANIQGWLELYSGW